ncbi:MAG: galactokinase [Clostridia bacterium]|nr:galactokinase [Clostridia bacterium]
MNIMQLKQYIEAGEADAALLEVYEKQALNHAKQRCLQLIDAFALRFGQHEREVVLISVPGRSELSGNHTDHNHGRVIAASIDLDVLAVAAARQDGVIHLESEGFAPETVCLSPLPTPETVAAGTSGALIAGMADGFASLGLPYGGFDACMTSQVLRGSGLSSSAAYEVAVGWILNALYCNGTVDAVTVAKLSQRAENLFFGKPCGLMDQTACAVGGMVAIDFADPKEPVVESIRFDMTGAGYALCIVDTGGNHADLTADYASVPAEMKAVASALGKAVLRETDEAAVLSSIKILRESVGDRAVLRALHFFEENKRVCEQMAALKEGDLDRYFRGVLASGRSSFCYLQNVYTTVNVAEQGLSLALCLAERVLAEARSAWRVHGGGFAGTIQAYVPTAMVPTFRAVMDAAFGEGACLELHIRPVGAVRLA